MEGTADEVYEGGYVEWVVLLELAIGHSVSDRCSRCFPPWVKSVSERDRVLLEGD